MSDSVSSGANGGGPPGAAMSPAWLTDLADSLAEALPRLYGTATDPLLTDLIAALTRALAVGEVSLDLRGPAPEGLDPALWPDACRRALEASALVSRS